MCYASYMLSCRNGSLTPSSVTSSTPLWIPLCVSFTCHHLFLLSTCHNSEPHYDASGSPSAETGWVAMELSAIAYLLLLTVLHPCKLCAHLGFTGTGFNISPSMYGRRFYLPVKSCLLDHKLLEFYVQHLAPDPGWKSLGATT